MHKLHFLRTVYIYIITVNSRYAMYKEMAFLSHAYEPRSQRPVEVVKVHHP